MIVASTLDFLPTMLPEKYFQSDFVPQSSFETAPPTVKNLFLSVCIGDFERANQLLESGFSLTDRCEEGKTLLHFIAEYPHTPVAASIHYQDAAIHQGLDVDALDDYGNTALFYAAMSGFEKTKYLLEQGADISNL